MAPAVLVLVVLVVVEPAALGRIEAPALAPPPAEAPALPAAPTALDEGLVVVVVVDVVVAGAAARTSMNTSIWPLLAVFMNVPAAAGMFAELAAGDEVADDDALPLALDVNDPVHWFWVSSC